MPGKRINVRDKCACSDPVPPGEEVVVDFDGLTVSCVADTAAAKL